MGLPRVRFLIACDAFGQSPEGKLTIYGVFDRIWAREFPFRMGSFSVVWEADISEDGSFDMLLELPSGERSQITPRHLARTSEGDSVRIAYALNGIQFPEAGKYHLCLVYNMDSTNETLSRYPLDVNLIPAQRGTH